MIVGLVDIVKGIYSGKHYELESAENISTLDYIGREAKELNIIRSKVIRKLEGLNTYLAEWITEKLMIINGL